MLMLTVPLQEEFAFRGGFQNALKKLGLRGRFGRLVAIAVTSVGFSLIHYSAYGDQLTPALIAILLIAGIACGFAYEFSGSIWTAVMTHLAYNILGLTVAAIGLNVFPIFSYSAFAVLVLWGLAALT
ncbi:lysostaphin resistance A-like protein, partial [Candidatus Omnitrophota bacterium]